MYQSIQYQLYYKTELDETMYYRSREKPFYFVAEANTCVGAMTDESPTSALIHDMTSRAHCKQNSHY
jgi:hypothetical protein